MTRGRDLPAELTSKPFTVAHAAELGVTRRVINGARFTAPFRGVRVPAVLAPSLPLLCQAARLVLPADAVFSHATAARLHGLPVPGDWQGEPLHVTTASRGLRHRGMTIHSTKDPSSAAVITEHGLAASSVPHCFGELAHGLSLVDLVVCGDHALRHGLATLAELEYLVAARRGRPGRSTLAAALPLLEPATDSPMETRLRLLLVQHGLPRPAANLDVVVDGIWLARPDLSYPDLKIAIEYEGDHHRSDKRQWRRDKTRRRLLEDAGWLVIEVIADDVYRTPRATVARVRAAIVARSPR